MPDSPNAVAFTFRGQPVTLGAAAIKARVTRATSLVGIVMAVIPDRAERERLGIVTQADAAEFLDALHPALGDPLPLPDALRVRRAPGRYLASVGRRRGPRITH